MSKIREILEDSYKEWIDMPVAYKKAISPYQVQAKAIKQEIVKMLPEKKEEPKENSWLDWDEKDFIHSGYNQAIDDMRRKVND